MAYDADDPHEASSEQRKEDFKRHLVTIMQACESRMASEVAKWVQSDWGFDLHAGLEDNYVRMPYLERPPFEDIPGKIVMEVWRRAKIVAAHVARGRQEAAAKLS